MRFDTLINPVLTGGFTVSETDEEREACTDEEPARDDDEEAAAAEPESSQGDLDIDAVSEGDACSDEASEATSSDVDDEAAAEEPDDSATSEDDEEAAAEGDADEVCVDDEETSSASSGDELSEDEASDDEPSEDETDGSAESAEETDEFDEEGEGGSKLSGLRSKVKDVAQPKKIASKVKGVARDVAHSEKVAAAGTQAKRAIKPVRAYFGEHEVVAVVAGMGLAGLCVILIFVCIYGFVISGVEVSKENIPDYVVEPIEPIENYNLSHLELRVSDISTEDYPSVTVVLKMKTDDGEFPPLDASLFSVSAHEGEETKVDVSVSKVSEGKHEDEVRVKLDIASGKPGVDQSIDLSVNPDTGYRGGATVGFTVPK